MRIKACKVVNIFEKENMYTMDLHKVVEPVRKFIKAFIFDLLFIQK
jgi:hypothetical protein